MAACLVGEAQAWRIEANTVELLDTTNAATRVFTRIDFIEPFDTTPVVVGLPSIRGANTSALKIRNVSTTGFEMIAAEPQGWDGRHLDMEISYIAAEPGEHFFPDGTRVTVGLTSVSDVAQFGGPTSFQPITFPTALSGTPAVLAAIQTMDSETANPPQTASSPWLTAAIDNVSAFGFDLALDRSSTTAGTPGPEDVGYIAIEAGQSGSFLDQTSVSTVWSATNTAATIPGYSSNNSNCASYTYNATGSAFGDPQVVASKNSRNEDDGGWLRYCVINGTSVSLVVDEDNINGNRTHAGDYAGIIAFDRPFHAVFEAMVTASKTVSVVADPLGTATSPYALPGSRVRYTISASNAGNLQADEDSIVLTDAIPPNMVLVVSDIASAGSGPVLFSDASPSSGLGYTFTSLSSASDSVSFSDDGGTSFTYTPTAGAGGTDPNVTHVRIALDGAFLGAEVGTAPSFSVAMDMIVQ